MGFALWMWTVLMISRPGAFVVFESICCVMWNPRTLSLNNCRNFSSFLTFFLSFLLEALFIHVIKLSLLSPPPSLSVLISPSSYHYIFSPVFSPSFSPSHSQSLLPLTPTSFSLLPFLSFFLTSTFTSFLLLTNIYGLYYPCSLKWWMPCSWLRMSLIPFHY